jgi:CheY-like chemotaxis protein
VRRILIVDDEHLGADTLGLIFISQGFDARTAYSAEQALPIVREFQPDLLLCDINMPGRTGLDLLTDVAIEQPACRALVLTGYPQNLVAVREQASTLPSAIRMLTKPCQPEELVRQANFLLAG